jgi:hypothetical protein
MAVHLLLVDLRRDRISTRGSKGYLTTTVYTGPGTLGQSRVTTSHFDSAGSATGVQSPIAPPTGGSAPLCPDSTSQRCNSVSVVDLAGRTSDSIDVYGTTTHTSYDIAGHPVRTIANYVPGIPMTFTSTQNITTDTRYDTAGRPLAVTSYLLSPTDSFTSLSQVAAGNVFVTDTTYDALGRSLSIVKPDSSLTATVYTKAGRVDRVSRPGPAGRDDSAVAWTRNLYDAAGRQTTTISDYDTTGAAGIAIEGFEGDSAGWDAGGGAYFLTGGPATISLDTTTAHTGLSSLSVNAAANQGAQWTLPGAFTTHHYHARVWVYVSAAATLKTYLGVDASGASNSVTTSASAGWNQIDLDWTPASAPAANSFKLAVVNAGAGAVTFKLDDVSVWDTVARDTLIKPNSARAAAVASSPAFRKVVVHHVS